MTTFEEKVNAYRDFVSLDVPQVRASNIDTIRSNCLRNGYKEALK